MSDWHRDSVETYGPQGRERCEVCNEWWPCAANELVGANNVITDLRLALTRITAVCDQFPPDAGSSVWQIALIATAALDTTNSDCHE